MWKKAHFKAMIPILHFTITQMLERTLHQQPQDHIAKRAIIEGWWVVYSVRGKRMHLPDLLTAWASCLTSDKLRDLSVLP